MVSNLRPDSAKAIADLKKRIDAAPDPLMLQLECLKSIAESLAVLAEKIGRRFP